MEKKKNDLEHAEVNIEKEINDLKYSKVEHEEFQEHNILISKLRMDREKLWAIRERIIDTFIQNGPFENTSDGASKCRVKKANWLSYQGHAVTDALMFAERRRKRFLLAFNYLVICKIGYCSKATVRDSMITTLEVLSD